MKLLLFVILFSTLSARAIEVDNFTNKFKSIEDSTAIINVESNKLFDEALEKANQKGSCNESAMYKELRKKFRNVFFGEFNKWLERSPDVPRLEIRVSESIYADMTAADSPVLGMLQSWLNTKLASEIQMGPYRFGTDKFEHFFGSGYINFRKHYLKGASVEKILIRGVKTEKGILGAITTGVFSYGDLSANFNGMRFWNNILAKSDDVLGPQYNQPAYVVCEAGKWQRVRDLNLLQYVDETWDESENCSAYRTKRIEERVLARIHALEVESGRSLACDQYGVIKNLAETKYAPFKEWLFPVLQAY